MFCSFALSAFHISCTVDRLSPASVAALAVLAAMADEPYGSPDDDGLELERIAVRDANRFAYVCWLC